MMRKFCLFLAGGVIVALIGSAPATPAKAGGFFTLSPYGLAVQLNVGQPYSYYGNHPYFRRHGSSRHYRHRHCNKVRHGRCVRWGRRHSHR